MGGETLESSLNPSPSNSGEAATETKKVVVVMGATGSGKSRLAIDLAAQFAGVEVINADSMQVYRGLDVLTNKVPLSERNGVPHHLLGTIEASMEFTSRDFRDLAVPIIDDILSRGGLPVIVGGTNYYIQALVSPFLVDDTVEDMGESESTSPQDLDKSALTDSYERLKKIDPVAANRIHPNDHRKVERYLSLYTSSGVLPSTLFQGKAAEKRGRATNFRYNCCFIWLDVSLPVLDKYVDQRVDCMIDSGLLHEVCDVYRPNADYTRGLRQAIGVREFEEFFKGCFLDIEAPGCPYPQEKNRSFSTKSSIPILTNMGNSESGATIPESSCPNNYKLEQLLNDGIERMKANTRKLVRRQIRRLNRLKTYFGWNLHYIGTTEAFLCNSGNSWHTMVIDPCIAILNGFLSEEVSVSTNITELSAVQSQSHFSRDLWSQYVCEACGNRTLRGAHEWEQHKRGRGHRKRVLSLKKRFLALSLAEN